MYAPNCEHVTQTGGTQGTSDVTCTVIACILGIRKPHSCNSFCGTYLMFHVNINRYIYSLIIARRDTWFSWALRWQLRVAESGGGNEGNLLMDWWESKVTMSRCGFAYNSMCITINCPWDADAAIKEIVVSNYPVAKWLRCWTQDLGVWGSMSVAQVTCKSLVQDLNPHRFWPPNSNVYQAERNFVLCEWLQLQKIRCILRREVRLWQGVPIPWRN